jgi:hypothetical protein
MVKLKDKFHGKTLARGTYIKPTWDEIYLNGRSGETPMEYDYAMTTKVYYNWQGLAMGERDWRG